MFYKKPLKQNIYNSHTNAVNKLKKCNFLIYCLFFCLCLLPTLALSAGSAPLYGLYEETIDFKAISGNNHSFSDPFYGAELNAIFTSPSGRKVNWFGFYDGNGNGGQSGNIWKIRFMPDEVGKWSYTWQFSSQGPSGSGSFTAVNASAKLGPLRNDSKIPQWLITADGSKHVFLNMNHTGDFSAHTNPSAAIADTINKNYDAMMIPGPAHLYWEDRTKNSTNPYQFMDTNNFVPRLQGWHFAENGIYKQAYDKGIYIYEFLGFYAGNRFYLLHRKPISFQNKVIKYWLARTAPNYIFLYNIGFELQEYVKVPSWPEERAAYINSINPWNHLITGHELSERGWSYGKASSNMSYSSLQTDKNFHSLALTVWNSASKSHAHCNECIWNGFPASQAPGTESSHRKDLWDGLTGGMSYAFLPWMGDKTGTNAFRHANAFLKSGVKWWEMSPHDEVIKKGTAYALANLGKEYIIYSSSGSSFDIQLPNGQYTQRWFNPSTGAFNPAVTLSSTSGTTKVQKPNGKDWVLHLKISGSQVDKTAPVAPTNLTVN